jgi:hypothetical protein
LTLAALTISAMQASTVATNELRTAASHLGNQLNVGRRAAFHASQPAK